MFWPVSKVCLFFEMYFAIYASFIQSIAKDFIQSN